MQERLFVLQIQPAYVEARNIEYDQKASEIYKRFHPPVVVRTKAQILKETWDQIVRKVQQANTAVFTH